MPLFVAHHEAGHAVAARALGIEILSASHAGNRHGLVQCADISADGEEGRYQTALLHLAGPAAQCVALGHDWRMAIRVSGGIDLPAAIAAVGDDDVASVFRPLAIRLIEERRVALDALAAGLQEMRTLTGEEVVAILDRADPTLASSILSVGALVEREKRAQRAGSGAT
ncbi:hypothetical protein WME89_48875 [Sorangium sp. So ce321]|uniref:hypothetical protein n=1 Tax=Sorangium sp. So ce321 TaxID=3133300 RepID=UPI003F64550E